MFKSEHEEAHLLDACINFRLGHLIEARENPDRKRCMRQDRNLVELLAKAKEDNQRLAALRPFWGRVYAAMIAFEEKAIEAERPRLELRRVA